MTPDDRLSALLRDAVDDVEPTDRLAEIRSRTTPRRTPRSRWAPLGGAVLAAAAVVTAVAVGPRALSALDPAPDTGPASSTPSSPSAPAPDEGPTRAVAAYFVADTTDGPRLFREFQPVASPRPGIAGLALLESGPRDPDYRTLWPAGSFALDRISDPEAGVVHVHLSGGPTLTSLAQQQVVYTVSAGFGEPLSVVFHREGVASDPVPAAPRADVVAPVNLSDPNEDQVLGDVVRLQGVAAADARDLSWRVLPAADDTVVLSGQVTPFGRTVRGPAAFVDDLDVSSLGPGTYTVIVETDGPAAYSDSRTFVLE